MLYEPRQGLERTFGSFCRGERDRVDDTEITHIASPAWSIGSAGLGNVSA